MTTWTHTAPARRYTNWVGPSIASKKPNRFSNEQNDHRKINTYTSGLGIKINQMNRTRAPGGLTSWDAAAADAQSWSEAADESTSWTAASVPATTWT